MRARIVVFLVVVQSILLLAHWFIYSTWVSFRGPADIAEITWLQPAVLLLSFSFVAASLLAFRISNPIVRGFYRMAAVWLGAVNFLFLAACACWVVYLGTTLARVHIHRPLLAAAAYGFAVLATLYGILNARWVRVRRIRIALPNLPESWRGRGAALVSDVHLGHVNVTGLLDRIVARLNDLNPEIVFITGDLYDGTAINAESAASPLKNLKPALGAYFVTGNHEEFRDPSQYLQAIRSSGVHLLDSEKVIIEGLQLVGVPDHASSNPDRFRSTLKNLSIERDRPSILLSHSPHALSIPEQAGISLQLSGHTHGGQIFPFTWFTRRIFGQYTYGLQRLGALQVYTTTGAGTWGPPLRVGTKPEIVLMEFE